MKYTPSKYLIHSWNSIHWKTYSDKKEIIFKALEHGNPYVIINMCKTILKEIKSKKYKNIKVMNVVENILYQTELFIRLEERGKYR